MFGSILAQKFANGRIPTGSQLCRRTLDAPSIAEQKNAVSHPKARRHMVRCHDECEAPIAVQVREQGFDARNIRRIESGKRFIAEQDLGLRHDGARKSRPAKHSPRQFTRKQIIHIQKAHRRQTIVYPIGDFRFGLISVLAKRQGHVVEDRHGIEQRTVLEEHSKAIANFREPGFIQSFDDVSRHPDTSSIGFLKPPDHSQQGALARPAPAHQDTDASAGKVAIEPLEYPAVAEGEGNSPNFHVTELCFGFRHVLWYLLGSINAVDGCPRVPRPGHARPSGIGGA